MKFGDYLKQQREERGWTQPMAAEKIGIEQSYLSKLETGKATPSEEMFERLAQSYNIDVDALSGVVSLGELERLREIAAVRDLVRRKEQATAQGRRRWLLVSLALFSLGGALLSYSVTERRFADNEYRYVSKGVILDGESDFIFGDVKRLDPGWIQDVLADSPILDRIDPVYRYYREHRGEYFIEPVEGGRRVYEEAGERHKSPTMSTHLSHAVAVAMILAGLGGFFVSRRW